jgi:hypothetical protein
MVFNATFNNISVISWWSFLYPDFEEEQTTQWPKEKVQKDKQRSTKHSYKTKDRATRKIYIYLCLSLMFTMWSHVIQAGVNL